jgi:hypothetical protein
LSLKTIDSSSFDEEGSEVGENNEMSISSFLDDSDEAAINGKRIYTPLNTD